MKKPSPFPYWPVLAENKDRIHGVSESLYRETGNDATVASMTHQKHRQYNYPPKIRKV